MAERHPSDHILVLNDGRIDEQGTLAELLLRSHEMQRLWHGDVAGYEVAPASEQEELSMIDGH